MAAKNVLQKHWDGTQWVELHPITRASNVITTADGRDVETHLGEKVNKVSGKGLSTNDYTDTDKNKLAGIAAGANNYTHPAAHPPSIITQDANNRFVTDSEKSAWNAKQSSLGFTPENPANKGVANGYAGLDASGRVPSSQLPSYVDDVLEYTAKANFPATGETGKIYIDLATNIIYRWSGSAYAEISSSLALGETSATAYMGDRGKIAYDHSQLAHAPSSAQKNSDITKAEIEAKLTGEIGTHTHALATTSTNGFMSSSDKSKLDASIKTVSYTLPATIGWYRIASSLSGINRNAARFSIDWTLPGVHGKTIFNAACMYGAADSAVLNQLHYSNYSAGSGVSKVRVVYHPTYSGNFAHLEIYNPTAAALVLTIDVINPTGWETLYAVATAGSVPTGYSSNEISLRPGIVTEGQFESTVSTGTAPLVVSSTTAVTNLNADLLDGKHSSDFVPAAHSGAGGAEHAAATTSAAGFMSSSDKSKLDGIATGANNYTHPANHPPSIIAQDANNRFVTDSEKSAWNAKQNSLGAGTTTQYLRGDGTWAVPPDTTYSAMSIAEANTGTATTSRTITASVLKSAIRTGAIDVVSSDPASLVAGQVYFLEV